MPLQDLVAVAIATLLPVYKRDQASGKLRPANAAELAEAGHAASGLLVARGDAETAAERLVTSYIGARPAAEREVTAADLSRW